MIPKVIHYCWFGRGPKPRLAKKCIKSWSRFCSDYIIKEWNEDNFDLDMCPYAREAYEKRKFAFVTDVVRLYALLKEGGIYMDTDVEVIKPLDSLLQYEAVSGFESDGYVPTGLMASRDGHPFIMELLDHYSGKHFIREDGSLDYTTNTERITNICSHHGLVLDGQRQTVGGCTFLPKDYLCPKDWKTREINLTENTLCIHHFDGSWTELSTKQRFIKFIGPKLTKFLIRIKHFMKLS